MSTFKPFFALLPAVFFLAPAARAEMCLAPSGAVCALPPANTVSSDRSCPCAGEIGVRTVGGPQLSFEEAKNHNLIVEGIAFELREREAEKRAKKEAELRRVDGLIGPLDRRALHCNLSLREKISYIGFSPSRSVDGKVLRLSYTHGEKHEEELFAKNTLAQAPDYTHPNYIGEGAMDALGAKCEKALRRAERDNEKLYLDQNALAQGELYLRLESELPDQYLKIVRPELFSGEKTPAREQAAERTSKPSAFSAR